jgi:hypothetical protein
MVVEPLWDINDGVISKSFLVTCMPGSNADTMASPQTTGQPLDVDSLAIQSQPNSGESSGTSRPTNVCNNGRSNDFASGSDQSPLTRPQQLGNL